MTAPLNLDSDWALIDGFEPVTLFRRQPDDTFDAGTSIPHGVLTDIRKEASADNPRLIRRRATWLLCPAEAGATYPVMWDAIQQASGTRWQVQTVTVHPLQSCYECHDCVEEVP